VATNSAESVGTSTLEDRDVEPGDTFPSWHVHIAVAENGDGAGPGGGQPVPPIEPGHGRGVVGALQVDLAHHPVDEDGTPVVAAQSRAVAVERSAAAAGASFLLCDFEPGGVIVRGGQGIGNAESLAHHKRPGIVVNGG